MNVPELKNILRKTKPENFRVSSKVRWKIENKHRLSVDKVIQELKNPERLTHVDEQPSRRPHEESYKLVFELSVKKWVIVVITRQTLRKKIKVVTAFSSNKKLKKLIKGTRLRMR